MGWSTHVIPPLELMAINTTPEEECAHKMISKLKVITMEAQDNLLHTKIFQVMQANKSCGLTFPFEVGGQAHLLTLHQRHEYKKAGKLRVTKFNTMGHTQ